MFENLKAFIRHGKYANEFRRKYPEENDTLKSKPSSIQFRDDIIDDTVMINQQEPVYPTKNEEEEEPEQEIFIEAKNNRGNARYEDVAAHIVEQEKMQRNKLVNYPNLHNYEVLEQMGEGAFSIVYKARHVVTGDLVAVKVLRKFQMDQSQKQAVLKEVTIMRQLNHLNIVKFIEFIDSSDYYYIVQELAIGGEIFTAIVKYTYLSEDLARHVIVQVAHAIRYLHEEVGIVHRDIKPENLLYQPIEFRPSANPAAKLRRSDDPNTKRDEGEFIPGVGGGEIGIVKLADFGLSKQIWEHNTKTPCGTVGYTAPEIVRDERYSKEVDMWAIGCVLYTLLCGFPPFYDERIEILTEKVAKGEFTFLSPWWDEISLEAKNCVSRLLTVDPLQRYTIDDFLRDPWVTKVSITHGINNAPTSLNVSASHPIQNKQQKYSKQYRYDSGLYSPAAAAALRDAFDISTAVHRMGEEAAYGAKMNAFVIPDVLEEEEDEQGHVFEAPANRNIDTNKIHRTQKYPAQRTNFDLNLGGASILERRKNKNITVSS